MKLSTKGRYGLRAMVDMAVNGEDGPVSILSIAKRQSISENYLEQIIALMKKANLVFSIRGATGGYTISRPLEEISVGDILRALEGDLSLVNCPGITEDGEVKAGGCEASDLCVTKYVWSKANKAVADAFDSISLKELAEESKKILEERKWKI